jgi:hypothetical protein
LRDREPAANRLGIGENENPGRRGTEVFSSPKVQSQGEFDGVFLVEANWFASH